MNNKGYVVGIYLSGYSYPARGFWHDNEETKGTIHLQDATIYDTKEKAHAAMLRAGQVFKFFPCVVMTYEDAVIQAVTREVK